MSDICWFIQKFFSGKPIGLKELNFTHILGTNKYFCCVEKVLDTSVNGLGRDLNNPRRPITVGVTLASTTVLQIPKYDCVHVYVLKPIGEINFKLHRPTHKKAIS